MTEWFKLFDFELIAPLCWGFESRQVLCNLSCGEAIQLAYGVLVALLICLFQHEILHAENAGKVAF